MPWATSARYREVIGGSHRAVVRARLLTTVQFVADPTGGVDLPLLDGDVRLSSTSDVKGSLDITVPGDYWEEVQPYGAEIFVERGVDFGDGTREYVPLGYYRIDDVAQDQAPWGPVRITARDRVAHLIDSRLIYPWQYPAGTTHRQLFDKLINDNPSSEGTSAGGLGMYITADVPIVFEGYNPDLALLPAGVVEDSTYEYLAKIADGRGCVLRADRIGRLCVTPRDRPPGTPPVYRVEPGRIGNLIKASRRVSRKGVYNMVVARGSDPAYPSVGLAYNTDAASPLRWYGPFGTITRYYSSPLLKTDAAADAAAETILARHKGLPTGTAVATVPDPSIDPLDPVTVVVGPTVEEHLVDEVTIPLVGDAPVQIDTRTLNAVPDDPGTGAGEVPGENPDPGGDPGTPAPGTTIAQVLKIGSTPGYNHVKLGVGFEATDPPGVHRDYSRSEIAAGLHLPGYAEVIGGRVRLTAHLLGARTSSNTKYPRTEFREMKADGTSLAAWDTTRAGTHRMRWRYRVLQMPPGKPQLCVGQIHDSNDDIAMVRLDSATQVNARFGDSEVVGSLATVSANVDYDAMLEVVTASDGASTCQIRYFHGPAGNLPTTPTRTKTAPTSTGWYFKTGCYGQSFATVDNEPDSRGEPTDLNDAPDFVIEMSKLEIWHTGDPEPLGWSDTPAPGGEDPGTDPGPGSGSSPVPSGATLLFSSDFTSGLSGWSTVQNKSHNGSSSSWGLSQYPLTIVNDGSGHETAARFEVRPGDKPSFGGERSEVRFPGNCNVESGDERWYEFDLKFAAGSQGADDWLYPMQWHAGSGSPPLAINLNSNRQLALRVDGQRSTIGPIDDQWHRYTLRVKFSSSAGSASHEVWRDGVKVLTVTGRKNMSSSSNYMKLGVYRRDSSFTSVLLFDRVRVWSP